MESNVRWSLRRFSMSLRGNLYVEVVSVAICSKKFRQRLVASTGRQESSVQFLHQGKGNDPVLPFGSMLTWLRSRRLDRNTNG